MRASKNFKYWIFPLLCGMVLLHGCKTSSILTGFEISNLYSPHSEYTIQTASLYNINDSISTLSVLIPTSAAQPQGKAGEPVIKGKLMYEVISAERHPRLVDSATFLIADTSTNMEFINHTWFFKAAVGKNYYIKATYKRPSVSPDLLALQLLRKQTQADAGWFRFQADDGTLLPDNIVTYSQPFRIKSELPINQAVNVKVYSRFFEVPIPPFIEVNRERFDYTPDSVFTLQFTNGVSSYFKPGRKGFYFFQSDSSLLAGPTLFVMDADFPKVNTHKMMIETLRYITSNADYRKMMSDPNPKMAIDSFWISSSGRADIATQLIKKYYSRVMSANELFTSFTPGWKTDRGMIYIIFGKPTQVFRSINQEVWVYGEYNDTRALRLYFDYVNNPFTTNDYMLIRQDFLKSIWYQSVQMWRR